MFSYSRVPDFWNLVDKYKNFPEFTDQSQLWGDLKEYQRLFILDEILKNTTARRILEVGGGQCQVLDAITKKYPERYECWSLDPLEGQGGGPIASRVLGKVKTKIKFVRESIGTFSKNIPDNYFDIVFSLSVLEHIPIPEWEACFLDMERVMARKSMMIHAVDLSLDFPSGSEYVNFLREIPTKTKLQLYDPKRSVELQSIKADSQTYLVSPVAYMRWLPHFPPGRNTLKNGIYCRVTSLNTIYKLKEDESA